MKYLLFLFGFIILLSFSCEKEKSGMSQETEFDAWRDQLAEFEAFGDVQIVGPVAIRLSILDKNLQPSSIFQEGENFVFSLAIMNLTDSTLYLRHHNINTEDLFKVFKIYDNSDGIFIGKPFYCIFCEKIGGNFIRSGEVWDLRISWLKDIALDNIIQCGDLIDTYHNETTPLLNGKYKTKFISQFTFTKFITDTLSFNIEFDII